MFHNGPTQVFNVVAVQFQRTAKRAEEVKNTTDGFFGSGSA